MELNYVGKIKLMANAAIHLNIGQLSCFAIFPFFSIGFVYLLGEVYVT